MALRSSSRTTDVRCNRTVSFDLGGPLCETGPDGHLIQIGIASFGSTLGCESGAPYGYTKVSCYTDWISEITGIKV